MQSRRDQKAAAIVWKIIRALCAGCVNLNNPVRSKNETLR